MKLIKSITIFSIALSIMLTVVILIYYTSILILFDDFLYGMRIAMLGYDIHPIIFALSFSLVPIWSLLVWRKKQSKSRTLFFSYLLIFSIMLLFICVSAFFLIDIFVPPNSPFMPEYVVWVPFRNFWNVVFPFASILTPFLFYLKFKNKAGLNKKLDSVLDN